MNATGKRTRKHTGMSRSQLKRTNHSRKSAAKRKRMGWYGQRK